MVTYRTFDDPIRRNAWPRPFGVLVGPASVAAAVAVACFTLGSLDHAIGRMEAAAAAVRPLTLVDPAAAAGVRRAKGQPLPAVAAAARAAQRGAPLPSPLTPSVGSLLGDFYNFPDGCTAGERKTSNRVCRLADARARKTLVVIGDSHAQMWMPTILRLGQSDGWTVVPFVKAGCVARFWARAEAGCAAWYRWAKQHAKALHPDVTLISGSWAATRKPDRDIAAIAALGAEMRGSSAAVIVIGDAPHQRRNPVDCLLSPRATMRTCTTRAAATDFRADRRVATNARRLGVGFIDTTGWFCARVSAAAHLCPMVIEQTIAWVDRGHISQTYGVALARPFRSAFRRELFR